MKIHLVLYILFIILSCSIGLELTQNTQKTLIKLLRIVNPENSDEILKKSIENILKSGAESEKPIQSASPKSLEELEKAIDNLKIPSSLLNNKSKKHKKNLLRKRHIQKKSRRWNKPSSHSLSFLQKNANKKSQTEEKLKLMGTYVAQEAKKTTILEDWITIDWKGFSNSKKFPIIYEGITQLQYKLEGSQMVNTLFKPKDAKKRTETERPIDQYFFFFRMNKKYIYFTNDDQTINVLGSIPISLVYTSRNLFDPNFCLELNTLDKQTYKLCAKDLKTIVRWNCYINKLVSNQDYNECDKTVKVEFKPRPKITRKLLQPYIIIPTPQRMCNAGWNYDKKGEDWECLCKEGKEQSPIDLPPKDKAIQAPHKPLFDFENRPHDLNGEKLKLEHLDHALTIKGNGFGRIITQDGTIYDASEIVIHTPSEHTINGESFPMEIQVVHKAKTKGDFGKKAILSFLFKAKPGIYNKFFDSVEFFNLPNPHDQWKELNNKLYIPNILQEANEEDIMMMKPFSLYTYNGSMTKPPCSENVIHYVASQPIELSITVIELFQEALRMPDFQDDLGNIIQSESSNLKNSRMVQALNGREVFHYDHTLYNCPQFKPVLENPPRVAKGHYEKQENTITNYFYVDGLKPSGMPGAMVVSKDEAGDLD